MVRRKLVTDHQLPQHARYSKYTVMNDQRTPFTHYAILIGINAYQDKALKGCVRDVQAVKRYLESVLDPLHLRMFTAIESTDPESSSPIEDPMIWPTYDNVTAAFDTINSLAKPGDFVYIHYSGHGTRAFSNKPTGDLALVLLNEGKEVQYLWGSRLAFSLKAMVDKGLVLTLVLDCCFSASIYRRDDPNVRFLPYDVEIGSRYLLDPEISLRDETCYLASRDACMRPNWLIDPDGYAILVACDPHKEAIELKADGQSHGALSYFLLKTLRERDGLAKKHKDIYDHLRAAFRKSTLPQNPALYGNKGQGFFGHTNAEITAETVPIVVKQDGSLELLAGQAHGVSDSDQFALCPLASAKCDPRSQGDSVFARVVHARAFTAELNRLDETPVSPKTGWTATALTRSSLQRSLIRLNIGLPHRNEWRTALKQRSLDFHIDVDKSPFSFHIILNTNKEYEILNESDQKIPNLPIMSQDQMDVSDVCDIIKHLARYNLVRDLANKVPADPFRESFEVHIISRSGEVFNPGRVVEVEQDDEVKFTLELQATNKGNKDLYVYIYDIGPCWQVKNIYSGSYEAIPPLYSGSGFTGMLRKKLKMSVPAEMREKGHRQCDDIIKIIVTSQPTSFDLLELPKLGEPVKRNTTSRTSRGGDHSSEDWAALNFPIRTSLK
jgi:Caspase domain